MEKRYYFYLLTLLILLPQSVWAGSIWSDVAMHTTAARAKNTNEPYAAVRRISADMTALRSSLANAPLATDAYLARSMAPNQQIELPMPDGSMQLFYVFDSPVMAYELARNFPQIKTYKVFSVADNTVSGRLDLGPNGFHAYLHTAEGIVYIDPDDAVAERYLSYYKHDYINGSPRDFSCGARHDPAGSAVDEFKTWLRMDTQARTSNERLTYRLAVATTGEYSVAVAGGNAVNTLAEVVTAINRVNQIYERDLAIHLELIANNDQIIYTNAATDPYSNDNASALLSENQLNLDSVIGAANYDIGHVFTTGGGGLAAFEVVCKDGSKAKAETGSSSPVGDPFYIDFVAHEIGHQFGADHTFNGTTDSCGGGNRNSTTAYEPGSGSTIMAYSGICGSEDVAASADATFHAGSLAQIVAYSRTGSGNSCASTAATGNTAPVASAGGDYTVPARTPFTLTGSATDVDPDTLIYQWDQMNAGAATSALTYGTDLCTNALFRSFVPSSDPSRTFPKLANLLSGTTDKAEVLPDRSRNLDFRLTVRDGNGGVDEDDLRLTVDGNSGPFTVLQPNTAVTLNASVPQVIEWNSACTELAPVNCTHVDILLSTDGGTSFTSLVAGSTLNDGAESVDLPATASASARIKIACVGNIFFDISDVNFAMAVGTGSTLSLTGNGGSSQCNVPVACGSTTPPSSGFDQEPNDSLSQAVAVNAPLNIVGSVNSTSDIDDFFSFVAGNAPLVFTLSGYGTHDLDLYLYDSTGIKIGESISPFGGTEAINPNPRLVSGQTYYINVQAWETSGLDSAYTLAISENVASGGGGGGGANNPWGLLLAILVMLSRGPVSRRRGFTD